VGNAAFLALIALTILWDIDPKGIKHVYSIVIKQLLNYSAMIYAIRSYVTLRIADGDSDRSIWDYLYWTHHLGATSPVLVEKSATCLMLEIFPDREPAYSFVLLGLFMCLFGLL
jgi:hypothetical protein